MFGQDFLSNYLGDFGDDYILIGGNACVLNFEKIKVPFRATVDLDLVLIVDRENSKFYSHLCDYLIEYGYTGGLYRCKNKGSCSYRFELKGEQKVERPKVIELFSRKPDYFDEELSEKLHITPIFTEDGISNMSAMLLDDEIYYFVVENQIKIDNISTVTLPCIFGLKSIAWHNNVELFKGSKVKEGDVYKHSADMIRIASVITGEEYLYPEGIFNSIQHSKEMFEEVDVLNNIPDVSENVGDVIEFINEFVRLKP